MTLQVEVTPIAEAQIEQAYCWYRERNPEFAVGGASPPENRWFRMNTIATLQEKPQRRALTIELTSYSSLLILGANTMAISKELRIDLDVLESILAEGDSATGRIPAYIDTETGEILLASAMLDEEMQDRKHFLKFPAKQLLSISEQTIEKWIENTLEIIAQNHGENFMLQAKTQLERAIKQINRVHSVTTVLIDLQGKGLDDNFYASWLEFVDREQVSNIRNWLFSKGMRLDG
jgi:hypothetical protein